MNWILALLIITVSVGRSLSAESTSSFRQVAVDAAAFLRKRQSTQHGGDELLPYFGGEEGSQCRRNVVELMENDEAIAAKRQDLLAIMKTQLYLEVVNRCSNEISLYDQASGLVCLLEEEERSNYNTTYAQFWGGDGLYGYVFYDGHFDLATMFQNTHNFTQLGPYATCGVDCYIGGGNGCADLEPYLPLSGNISVNEVCNLQWGEIDDAFCALRVCASKAIAKPANGQTKEEYVNTFLSSQLTSSSCTFNYCEGGD